MFRWSHWLPGQHVTARDIQSPLLYSYCIRKLGYHLLLTSLTVYLRVEVMPS